MTDSPICAITRAMETPKPAFAHHAAAAEAQRPSKFSDAILTAGITPNSNSASTDAPSVNRTSLACSDTL